MNEPFTTSVNASLSLRQRSEGLRYGTDAYLLFAYLRRRPKARAVELGSGSGIISLLALQADKLASVCAIEVQEAYAKLTAENAAENELGDRLNVLCANVKELTVTSVGGEADIVFSNPPYMRADSGKMNGSDEKTIARHEVLATIGDFCEAGSRILKTGGSFYAVWRPDRLSDLLSAMERAGIPPKRMTLVYPDQKSVPCLMLVEGKKGAKSGMFVTKPLLLHENASASPLVDSADCKIIYENGDFPDEYIHP